VPRISALNSEQASLKFDTEAFYRKISPIFINNEALVYCKAIDGLMHVFLKPFLQGVINSYILQGGIIQKPLASVIFLMFV
jgi:hypothetical protein